MENRLVADSEKTAYEPEIGVSKQSGSLQTI